MLTNGRLHVRWYRKESCKNIILHAHSAHPSVVKRAIIRNMIKTAATVCSGEDERRESLKMASEILRTNGYSPLRSRIRRLGRRPPTATDNLNRAKISLCLPFISDGISNAIKKCLVQAQLDGDVCLVNIPSGNLKQQLVRNRLYDMSCNTRDCVVCPYGKIGDCGKSGVVYQIECLDCHAIYIGETGRPLFVRLREHLASKRRRSLISPLGKHRSEDHSDNDFDIKCTILTYEDAISARKTLEAAFIFARKPKMNGKNEQLSITSDLMPFLPSCRL